jgi:hypothetical protein
MLTKDQAERIEREAYLPEHLPDYVCAISGAEPFCFENYLVYVREGVLIFIGYPLGAPFDLNPLEGKLSEAVRQCKPGLVSLIAPALPASLGKDQLPSDQYYRLDLKTVILSPKTRNMLRRAGRELTVQTSRRFGPEHGRLVEDFLRRRPVDEATRSIFAGIDRYLDASRSARIFEARNGAGELVAFDVAEFRPRDYAFYMFNVTAADRYVPGASDLLLARVIEQAVAEGKKFVNLGLGINPGVAAFKTKWGGVPFLPHTFHQYHPAGKGLLEMLLRWLKNKA